MIRTRCMSLIFGGGLLLVCGCCFSLPERPWFGRHHDCCSNGNGDFVASGGGPVVTEGPILMDTGPPPYAGPNGAMLSAPAPTAAPQLSSPPRLSPNQAQTVPWQSTNRSGT